MNEDAKSKFNIFKEYTVRFRATDGGTISIPIIGATDKDHAVELAQQFAQSDLLCRAQRAHHLRLMGPGLFDQRFDQPAAREDILMAAADGLPRQAGYGF